MSKQRATYNICHVYPLKIARENMVHPTEQRLRFIKKRPDYQMGDTKEQAKNRWK